MFYSKNLKKIKQIKHCFFSRKGGFSKGIYKGLNCGKGSKDNKKSILKNINYVAKKMKVKKENLISHRTRFIETQVNGNDLGVYFENEVENWNMNILDFTGRELYSEKNIIVNKSNPKTEYVLSIHGIQVFI